MITLSIHWTCLRPVTHAQTWASYTAVYRLSSLSKCTFISIRRLDDLYGSVKIDNQ